MFLLNLFKKPTIKIELMVGDFDGVHAEAFHACEGYTFETNMPSPVVGQWMTYDHAVLIVRSVNSNYDRRVFEVRAHRRVARYPSLLPKNYPGVTDVIAGATT